MAMRQISDSDMEQIVRFSRSCDQFFRVITSSPVVTHFAQGDALETKLCELVRSNKELECLFNAWIREYGAPPKPPLCLKTPENLEHILNCYRRAIACEILE